MNQRSLTAMKNDQITVKELTKLSQELKQLRHQKTELETLLLNQEQQIEQLKTLQEKERLLQLVLDNIPQLIFWKDCHSVFQGCNRQWAKAAGFSHPKDVIGKTDQDLYPNTTNLEEYLEKDRQVINSGQPQYHLEYKPNKDVWYDTRKIPIRDSQGEIVGLLATIEDITQRKKAEEALRLTEQKYRSIFENALEGIFQSTPDGNFLSVNPALAHLYGYESPADLMANLTEMNTQIYIDPTWQEEFKQQMEEKGEVKGLQYQVHQQTGKIIWVEENTRAVWDDRGDVLYYEGSVQDITKRKQAEQLLTNYQRTLEAQIAQRTQALEKEIHERQRKEEALELIFKGTATATGNDFFNALVENLAKVFKAQYALIGELSDRSKTQLNGQPEEAPAAASSKLRTLAFWTGEKFTENFEYSLVGTPSAHVVHPPSCLHFEDIQTHFPQDTMLVKLGAKSYWGSSLCNAAGEVIGILAILDTQPLHPNPTLTSIFKIFAARAGAELERKQTEAALLKAKKAADTANHAKSTFIANMSHELRTPLNAILGFAQLLGRDTSLKLEQRQQLDIINRSGEHLLSLINSILEMSKIEAGRTTLNETSFDLHHLLSEIQDLFYLRAQDKGLQLSFNLAPDLPQYISTDESKLRQILLNLLGNAIKFTEEGSITLRASVSEQGSQCVAEAARSWGFPPGATAVEVPSVVATGVSRGAGEQGSRGAEGQGSRGAGDRKEGFVHHTPHPTPHTLSFEVEDTGPGIAAAELDKLFIAFEQTDTGRNAQQGTGLGLSISRKFVQLMGGKMSVSSTVGVGSCFQFEIQIHLSSAAAVLPKQLKRRVIGLAPNQQQYRILVVDDRFESRLLLVKLLSSVGFQVREAVNGQEAIAVWEAWEPHLIWMDMRMPVMNGYEATQQIRAKEQGKNSLPTIIIALTASAFEEERTVTRAAGCDAFVRKPFREAVIWDTMAQYLGVQYLYEEEPVKAASNPSFAATPQPSLNLEALGMMPIEWLSQLYEMAKQLNRKQIFKLIEEIPETHSLLAKQLRQLAQSYRFDKIAELARDFKESK